MPSETASQAFNCLLATELKTVDRDGLAAAMRFACVVRGWLDVVDVECSRRARELAASDGAESAEGMLIDNGRRSGREARATGQREKICNQVPEMEAALATGDVSTDHVDALAQAAQHLDDAERADLFAMGAMLAAEAAEAHVESFGRTCRDLAAFVHNQHNPADDSAQLDRQRAASKISRWVDQITGMHNTTISLDPLRDAKLWQLLDAEIARQKQIAGNSKTPFSLLQVEALFAALTRKHGATGTSSGECSGTAARPSETTPHQPANADAAPPTDNIDADDVASGIPGSNAGRTATGEAGNAGHRGVGGRAGGRAAGDTGTKDEAGGAGAGLTGGTAPGCTAPGGVGTDGGPGSTNAVESRVAASEAGNSGASAAAGGAGADIVGQEANASGTGDADQDDAQLDDDVRRHPPSQSSNDTRSSSETARDRQGHATGPPNSQPSVPEVYVHIDLATLIGGLHAHSISELSNGVPLPVSTVRRMCCDANIIPVVLNGNGELLDVGREYRTATRAQRRALRALYRTCAHPHCTVAFDNCRIHHIEWWDRGGVTDLRNLLPLCETHHHLVHEGGWNITMSPDRRTTWHQPTGAQKTSEPDRQPPHHQADLFSTTAGRAPEVAETFQPMLC